MRRKIWQDTDVQCSLIGTCLSLAELKKIARKTQLVLDPRDGEFELHAVFVKLCNTRCPTSMAVNKLLDRKYQAAIRTFSKVHT